MQACLSLAHLVIENQWEEFSEWGKTEGSTLLGMTPGLCRNHEYFDKHTKGYMTAAAGRDRTYRCPGDAKSLARLKECRPRRVSYLLFQGAGAIARTVAECICSNALKADAGSTTAQALRHHQLVNKQVCRWIYRGSSNWWKFKIFGPCRAQLPSSSSSLLVAPRTSTEFRAHPHLERISANFNSFKHTAISNLTFLLNLMRLLRFAPLPTGCGPETCWNTGTICYKYIVVYWWSKC